MKGEFAGEKRKEGELTASHFEEKVSYSIVKGAACEERSTTAQT